MATDRDPLLGYLKVQSRVDSELRKILREAAVEVAREITRLAQKPGVGSRTREAQLALFLEFLKEYYEELWVHEIMPVISKAFPLAIQAANQAAEFIDQVLRTAVGEQQAEALLDSVRVQARLAQQLDLEARGRLLSTRVWNNVDRAVELAQRRIQTHLVTGSVNARELARDVRGLVDPSTPGGTSYAAMRLARTEINTAFHERQKQIAEEKPGVEGVRWNLSRSHPRKDRCDVLAEGHSPGKRRGVYVPGSVPDKPHPQCLCFLTYEMMPERDFVNMLRAELGKAPLVS